MRARCLAEDPSRQVIPMLRHDTPPRRLHGGKHCPRLPRAVTTLAFGSLLAALLPAQTWTASTATGPSARYSHGMAYDAANGEVVIFGGYEGNGQNRFADTWVWDGTTWEDVTPTPGPGSSPSPRSARMAYDEGRERVVLFGGSGYDLNDPEGDTWEWDGATRTWTDVTPTASPVARFGHAMAYDGQRIVMVGGRDGTPTAGTFTQIFDETWGWDGTDWTSLPTIPVKRHFHAMAYDSTRDRVVVFGGGGLGVAYDDTWEWNGSAQSWSERTSRKNPPEAFYSTMTFDSARGRTVLFGGRNTNNLFLGDTWEWDGSKWSKIGGNGPGRRMFTGMAFDSANGQTVLFGGWGFGQNYSQVIFADTWTYGSTGGGGGGGGGGRGR